MNQEFVLKLAMLAFQYGPELVDSVRDLIKKYGEPHDEERYEAALEVLRKDPEAYFGARRADDPDEDSE